MQKIPKDHWLRVSPIAHRGMHNNSSSLPENTLASFEEACKKGYAIELDVRTTKDGKAVVYHDSNLKRLTGINKKVKNLSSKEITNFLILNTQERIPLLDEVLELVNGRVPVLIEIKRNFLPGRLENYVINTLRTYKGEFAVLSFNPFALRYIHTQAPDYISGINIGNIEKFAFKNKLFNKFINNFSSPHFISYSLRGSVPKISTIFFRKLNLPILAWTVSSIDEEISARKFADNIIFESYIPK